MKKLDELKIADRTVVIFTSDNGGLSVKEGPNTPATSNAPLRAGKGYLYEGGIRVPLIVALARRDQARQRLRRAGQRPGPLPDHPGDGRESSRAPARSIDGVSLVPLLKRDGRLQRDALFWHYPHYSNQGGKPGGAVRQGDFKLIEFYEDGKLELYDLKQDIGEKNDLAAERPEEAAGLAKLLPDWRESVGAQMPTPNPDFDPAKR